jgi:acetyltransferase-like isoleucine patch superfamily enzyme
MKRVLFYILSFLALVSQIISTRLYMHLLILAHKSQGVIFKGNPEYIQRDAFLDPSGGLTIYDNVVISTRVIILTHDWSFLKRAKYSSTENIEPYSPVVIGSNSFVGAGAIILPGTTIGRNCIIGAGSVVKGIIEDDSIIIGNPSKKIGSTK